MLPSLTKIFLSKKSKKCKVIQMLEGFHQSKIVVLAPATASMSKVVCLQLTNRICKYSSLNRKTSMVISNIVANIIRILKMLVDRFKWQSRIWRKWMLRRGISMSIWPNLCTNSCKLSPQDTRPLSMPSAKRRWWIRRRRSKSWNKKNHNKTWCNKKMMTLMHSPVVLRETSASFPSLKRSLQTINQLKKCNHFNFNGSLPQR